MLFTANPSTGFIWAFLIESWKASRMDKLDQAFDTIVKDLEEVEDSEEFVHVAIVENKAYWVIGNMFYEADIVDGEVDRESSRQIDAFKMSSKDLNKMLHILDNLT
tara:strand:- start:746 stop:1063 length:318 start_codon:yes stop_codon:yes gene_type:complete